MIPHANGSKHIPKASNRFQHSEWNSTPLTFTENHLHTKGKERTWKTKRKKPIKEKERSL
jgi:hypothetical protein